MITVSKRKTYIDSIVNFVDERQQHKQLIILLVSFISSLLIYHSEMQVLLSLFHPQNY
jgi:hypothetical protein